MLFIEASSVPGEGLFVCISEPVFETDNVLAISRHLDGSILFPHHCHPFFFFLISIKLAATVMMERKEHCVFKQGGAEPPGSAVKRLMRYGGEGV